MEIPIWVGDKPIKAALFYMEAQKYKVKVWLISFVGVNVSLLFLVRCCNILALMLEKYMFAEFKFIYVRVSSE